MGAPARRTQSVNSPIDGNWNHIIVERVDDTVYVYLNNVLIGSKVLTNRHLELDSNNLIGASIFNGSTFSGEIKKFLFFDYALDSTERTNIYNDF